MIVESPLTFGLTIGADRRIPNEDDSKVFIPATVQPVVLMLQPHSAWPNISTIANGSAVGELANNITNAAGVDSILFTLPRGLWKLQITLASGFNWAATPPALSGATVSLLYQGFSLQLITRTAAIGSFFDTLEMDFIFQSDAVLSLLLDTNGVAQTTTAKMIGNAIRVL